MINCIDCDKCKITVDTRGSAKAKCKARNSNKDRLITWSCTSYITVAGELRLYEKGEDRVRESLQKKKKSPPWCPLLEGVNKDDVTAI